MSLSSLRGAAGFASTALDTARSTWKGLADAAVNADDTAAEPVRATPAPVAEDKPAAPAARKGARIGTVLDAYA